MATILKFQPMMMKIEKIAMTMVEIVMTTAIAVERYDGGVVGDS